MSRQGHCPSRPYRMTPDAIRMRAEIKRRRKQFGYTYAPGEREKRGIKKLGK